MNLYLFKSKNIEWYLNHPRKIEESFFFLGVLLF